MSLCAFASLRLCVTLEHDVAGHIQKAFDARQNQNVRRRRYPHLVKDGKVIHHSWNMSLPHVEFVRPATGQLPEGAWVGTVSKLDGEIAVISSKHFFGYQLPAPPRCRRSGQRHV